MPRRLPILPLTMAMTVGLFFLMSALTAQPPAAAPTGTPGEGIKRSEEEAYKLYNRFAAELLKLAQKWEKSDNQNERDRAKTLRAALKLADERGVESLFKAVVNGLSGAKNPTGGELEGLLAKDRTLIKALEEILETLETEDEAAKLNREIKELQELIKEVSRIKRNEENILARTNVPKSDPNRIAKDQADLAKQTKDLAGRMKGDSKDPKNANSSNNNANPNEKDDKSEPKAEGKPGDSSAEPKADTKDPKSDGKESKGDMGDSKSDPKKEGMNPDAGSSKESPKSGSGDPKSGKGMGEPKATEPKSPMGGDPKPSNPSESKAQGDGKGSGKPSQGQGGDAKPMSPSGGKPGDSPPSDSKGSPSGGQPGSPPSGSPSPPNPSNPNDDARRKLEDSVPPQENAEKELKKDDRNKASKHEDDAIRKLDEVLKELEKRLKQLRDKEKLKKLEDLERRVTKMLKMQIEVYEATKGIDAIVKKNKNQKTTSDIQKAGVEGEKEGEIVLEADKALRLLEGEGTAVVFAGVLVEVRKDMESVQKQLQAANVGGETQLVEEQIIAQLQQMLEALKKAKQDLQNPPPPPPPGQPPPPNDSKKNLIQLVEQLKLLKSLQVQVNDRTTAFGKRAPGEQVADPFLQEQLRQLGDRQKVLQSMLHKIASQMNEQ